MSDPTNRNGYPLADDLRETMASALGMDVDEGWLSIAITLMEQTTTGSVSPRTWTLPAEPGPEVTHVRSERGIYDGFTLWERNSNGGWCLIRKDGAVLCIYGSWLKLLAAVGPLTDATGEQS